MAEAVVDGLEVVEIEDKHRDLPGLAGGSQQGMLDAVMEQDAVGEPSQGVIEFDLVVGPPALWGEQREPGGLYGCSFQDELRTWSGEIRNQGPNGEERQEEGKNC